MEPLPLEILTMICKHLDTKDLLQCQLIDKQWQQASTKQLYTEISLNNYGKTIQDTETILKTPKLSKYLKVVSLSKPVGFKNVGSNKESDLLILFLPHCPNLVEIRKLTTELIPWEEIIYAAESKQLLSLQRLPLPETKDLDSYLRVALAVKNTLTTLYICDADNCLKEDLQKLPIYQSLYDNISTFPKLQDLTLSYPSNFRMSLFNTLIDKCTNLTRLHIETSESTNAVTEADETQIIQPSNDIRVLSARWESANNINELSYIMRKFPNLQSLRIDYYGGLDKVKDYDITDVLFNLINYIINIPNCNVCLPIRSTDLLHALNDIKTLKEKSIEVDMKFVYRASVSGVPLPGISIMNWKGKKLTVEIIDKPNEQDYIRTAILPKFGDIIRKLNVERSIIRRSTKGMKFLTDSVRLCPQLEELIMTNLTIRKLKNCTDLQHPKMKLLTLLHMKMNYNLKFLESVSKNCPELKQLRLEYYTTKKLQTPVTKIFMPHSNFELISWSGSSLVTDKTVFRLEAYFKMETSDSTKFYHACKNKELMVIDEDIYNKSLEDNRKVNLASRVVKVYFDITCQNLTEFNLKWRNCHPNRLTWVF